MCRGELFCQRIEARFEISLLLLELREASVTLLAVLWPTPRLCSTCNAATQ